MDEHQNIDQITENTDNATEPKLIYGKNGRKIICTDWDLAESIMFPFKRVVEFVNDVEPGNINSFLQQLEKSDKLFSSQFGNIDKKEMFFNLHRLDKLNFQKIFTHNEYATVQLKAVTHKGTTFIRFYKLILEEGNYKFFKFFSDAGMNRIVI